MNKQRRLVSAERRRALLRKRNHLMVERRQKWFRLTQRDD
ncbi:hypothetical protein SAMN06297229_2214 [Pseudidiomarina planktonica]|uniref:Uncharacterized protein n=1 Tax=Pseudidiomarina planktonica TaxID=1323738 RepID=A0A1Y6FZF1_9GAMM|nr:hypothetical protein SAMN06297229_2214 [Pseudidiomarina planktonica]